MLRTLYIVLSISLLMALSGCNDQDVPNKGVSVLTDSYVPTPRLVDSNSAVTQDTSVITHDVLVLTTMGEIVLGLYGFDAPLTVQNFTELIRRKVYNGTHIHRLSRDYVIQMGDPNSKDLSARDDWGQGGYTASGRPLPEELDSSTASAHRGYEPGVVAMARKQSIPESGTSQFFICLDKATVLPYKFTIFGRVLSGAEVIQAINALELQPGLLGAEDGMPVTPVQIISVTAKRRKTIANR